MEEGDKVGTEDNARRVRVERLPEYREMRRLLRVWLARPKTHITGLYSKLWGLRGTPQNPVDWKDPDTWIARRVSGEDRELAQAIWTKSGVNPRYTGEHWRLTQNYELLAEDADGELELTERGSDFIDHEFGKAEAFLDEQEGLIKLLTIVDEAGSARSSALREPWAEYLGRHSRFQARTTIDFTLSWRLKNLVDRDLVSREGSQYSITEAGLDYLKRVGAATGTLEVPAGIKRYADDEVGRTILAALADSIEFAHSLNRVSWATLFDRRRRDMRLYVGSTLMMVLEASRKRVEVTLSGELEDEQRHRMRSARVLREYAYPEGAKRYLLSWNDFVEQWESMRKVHQETMRQVVMKAPRSSAHSTDAIDFLNQTLGRELPKPLYVGNGDDSPSTTETGKSDDGGFELLTQSLRDDGLLFSHELVANYLLALQTKRFAILTGISGTGKTRIAKAVAQHFGPVLKRRVPKIPDGAVGAKVKTSYIELSKIVLPVAITRNLSIETGGSPRSGPQIWVRYPGGRIQLGTYLADGKYPVLRFKEGIREWFQSTFKVGDPFWLRVRPGEEDDSEEVEIGLTKTEFVERRIDHYVVIPVRPDWVDNRGLLGYLNPLTNEYSTTRFLNLLLRAHEEEKRAAAADEKPHPFFVILDEMNLARVEHYFSDFLSALESGEPIPLHEDEAIESGESESGLQVPKQLEVPGNVLFTGTVNVDETTYMFSPKVLDRAFTIEFDQVDLEGFTKGKSSDEASGLTLDGAKESLDLLRSGSSGGDDWKPSREDWVKFSEETGGHQKALLRLHRILEAQHRHFGYRVANEIARFVNLAREQAADAGMAVDAAFDLALLQKVLPKFHGTQQELESLLERIFHFAVHGGEYRPKQNEKVDPDDWKVVAGRLTANSKPKSPAPSGDAGSAADEPDPDDAKAPGANPQSPAYPRTGAKVLRMLQRLRDRGFTSFIE